MNTRIITLLFALCVICGKSYGLDFALKTTPQVHPSAEGWSLKISDAMETIVVYPDGSEKNIGQTMYPDWVTTTIVLLDDPETEARSLVIYMPPVSSGATRMTVVDVTKEFPKVTLQIEHHYEFGFSTGAAKEALVDLPDHQIALRRLIFPQANDALAHELISTFESKRIQG